MSSENPSSPGQSPPNSVLVRSALREQPADVDGMDAAFAVTRLGGLVHELANLLDGSMRQLNMARRDANTRLPALPPGPTVVTPPGGGGACAPTVVPPPAVDEPGAAPASELCRRLDVVGRAMEQMSCVVKRVLAGIAPEGSAGSTLGSWSAWSLAEAIEHAAEVLRLVAADQETEIVTAVDPRLETAPAGSIYMILTAAVRNSIESIARRRQVAKRGTGGTAPRGRIEVAARLDDSDPRTPMVRIEVRDDGFGPPAHAGPSGEQLFVAGFSTKAGGLGIGLALAREIVRELAGSIGLAQRFNPALSDGARGATLSVSYPVGPALGKTVIGESNG